MFPRLGGSWRTGDKSDVQKEPQAFVDRGFVLVSINYHLLPDKPRFRVDRKAVGSRAVKKRLPTA